MANGVTESLASGRPANHMELSDSLKHTANSFRRVAGSKDPQAFPQSSRRPFPVLPPQSFV